MALKLEEQKYSNGTLKTLATVTPRVELESEILRLRKIKSSYIPKTVTIVSLNGDESGKAGSYTVAVSSGSSPVNDVPRQAECRVEVKELLMKKATHKYKNTYGWINKADEFIELQTAYKVYTRTVDEKPVKADISKVVKL
jgi:hypothetical protein|tara:strand:+ start:472 stop:894 length:423 start_codon:yes stop_codon:yes gene_type:complete